MLTLCDFRSYEAGDVLEIRPQNSAEDVQRFLTSVGWTDIADELYSLRATSPGAFSRDSLRSIFATH